MLLFILIAVTAFSFGDVTATARPSNKPPCARMSTTTISNTTLPNCRQFHTGAVAILLPSDNNTVKFGAVYWIPGSNSFAFVDRTGDRTPMSKDLIPEYLANASVIAVSQMVFKATLQLSIIVKLEAVLMIDQVRQQAIDLTCLYYTSIRDA